jgi:aminopeptidase YwaD
MMTERISAENLMQHVRYLSGFEKLSGSRGAHQAVEYITDVLHKNDVPVEIYRFQEYLSNPISSMLQLQDGQVIRSRPRSFSLNLPRGLKGELFYDDSHWKKKLTPLEVSKRLAGMKGKIVLSHGFDERYAKQLEKAGALAWIQIWDSPETEIHEDTVSSVWGTPDLDSSLLLLQIPVLCVNLPDGNRLIQYAKEAAHEVFLSTCVETAVQEVEVPVALIQGESEEFVLVSGHYDTWYAGAMDNVTANAACLEIARVLQKGDKPRRTVRIAWWAGHSNGRYAGSAWYYDHFFQDLRKHCLAHINSDLIGSQLGEVATVITTGLEGRNFEKELIRTVDPQAPVAFKRFGRGADQSFWGAGIPYNLMTRYEVLPEKRTTTAPGGSPWWHTKEDTFEKVSPEVLLKETKIFLENVALFAGQEILPVDFSGYFGQMIERLQSVQEQSDDCFDFSPCIEAVKKIQEKTTALYRQLSGEARNRLVKLVGGTMNWLMQTYGSPYGQDLAYAYGMFPHLTAVAGSYRKNTDPAGFLFLQTEFQRQKNRLLTELELLEEKIGWFGQA